MLPLIFLLLPTTTSHDITSILSLHPSLSTFNHYLNLTHLTPLINSHKTITVLSLSNPSMSSLLSSHPSLPHLKNILSLHVLVDYFSAKKLHQITGGTALSSTLFQASGEATGMAGFVNITNARGGKVLFRAEGEEKAAEFVREVKTVPYSISVLEISRPLVEVDEAAASPDETPTVVDVVDLMAKKGCKMFADLITAANVSKILEKNIDTGLTVFCPMDQVMKPFLPKYKNLSPANKTALLLYHALPVYESLDMLKAHNGLVNTLATTSGKKNFHIAVKKAGEVVMLNTKVTSAKITGTLIDLDPLVVYTIDQILEPSEMFKPEKAEAPVPALAPAAEAPKKGKGKGKAKGKKKKEPEVVEAPTPAGPDGQPEDDEVADKEDNGAGRRAGEWVLVAISTVVGLIVMC